MKLSNDEVKDTIRTSLAKATELTYRSRPCSRKLWGMCMITAWYGFIELHSRKYPWTLRLDNE